MLPDTVFDDATAYGVSRAAKPEFLDLLTPLGTVVALKAGQDLFNQGDAADALYVVLDGLAEISSLSNDGRRVAHLLLAPGTVFGEMALIEGGQRSTDVSAKQPTQFLRVARNVLLDEVQHNNALAVELLQLTIARLRWMSTQLEDYAFQSLSVRLARRLIVLSQTIGEDGVIKISQSDLAEHVAATREAISKILSGWRADGIVDLGRGRVMITDLDKLHGISEAGLI